MNWVWLREGVLLASCLQILYCNQWVVRKIHSGPRRLQIQSDVRQQPRSEPELLILSSLLFHTVSYWAASSGAACSLNLSKHFKSYSICPCLCTDYYSCAVAQSPGCPVEGLFSTTWTSIRAKFYVPVICLIVQLLKDSVWLLGDGGDLTNPCLMDLATSRKYSVL